MVYFVAILSLCELVFRLFTVIKKIPLTRFMNTVTCECGPTLRRLMYALLLVNLFLSAPLEHL